MNPRSTPIALVAGLAAALAFTGGLTLGPVPSAPRQPLLAAPVACVPPARSMARLELLFGTTKPDGGSVSEADWLAFLDAEVTPRFPEGLTVLTGLGQWRDSRGQIARETARLLLIWHVAGPQTEAQIATLRSAYRQRFSQESVMRVDGAGCVGF